MKKIFGSLLSATLILGVISSAEAHTSLIRSNPKVGAVLAVSPKYLELVYDEELTVFKGKKVNTITLLKLPQTKIQISEPLTERNRLRVNLRSTLKSGQYIVEYRVVSADGHIVKGSFKFQVKLLQG